MARELIQKWAQDAASNPALAPDACRQIADALEQDGEDVSDWLPPGYLYAGAHQLIARFDRLPPDLLPSPDPNAPEAPELWDTAKKPVVLRVPFDCIAREVYGLAKTLPVKGPEDVTSSPLTLLSTAESARDLFACSWRIDGHDGMSTDGEDEIIAPASVTIGTRLRPRRYALRLRRNQRIIVRAKSLVNVFFSNSKFQPTPPDLKVEIVFSLVNTEAP